MFIVCVVAAVMIERDGHPLLFGLAALVAFGNLFSSHLICTLDGCRFRKNLRSWRDPAYVAFLANRITGVIGVTLLVHALSDLY